MAKDKIIGLLIMLVGVIIAIVYTLGSVVDLYMETLGGVPGGFEVLIVDGESNDGTQEIISTFCEEHKNLRILKNPNKIVPTAMNIRIKEAKGKWIARLQISPPFWSDVY